MSRTRSGRGPSKASGHDAAQAADPVVHGDGAEGTAPSFEASAERLTAIVEQLEGGELSLEDSLKLFEEGVRVARAAQQRLDRAERRVEELLGIDEQGEPVTRGLDEDE